MITKEEVFEGEYSQFDVITLLERIAELEKELEFFYEEAMNSLAPPKEKE